MAEQESARKLGISFGGENICLADVHGSDGKYRVLNLAKIRRKSPFFSGDPLDTDTVADIAEDLKEVIEDLEITATDVCFSVNRRFAVIKRIPADPALNAKELKDHNSWELSQYITTPLSRYNHDCQLLSSFNEDYKNYLLSVGIRKEVIGFFKDLARALNLEIKLIDVDLFACFNAYIANSEINSNNKMALIIIGKDYFHLIIHKGKDFLGFQTIYAQREDRNFSDNEILLKEINKSLKLLSSDLEVDREKFEHIYMCRNTQSVNIGNLVEQSEALTLEPIESFNLINLGRKVTDQVDLSNDNSFFLEAIGLTVRDY